MGDTELASLRAEVASLREQVAALNAWLRSQPTQYVTGVQIAAAVRRLTPALALPRPRR